MVIIMKKRNLIIFITVCFLSIVMLSILLVSVFRLQAKKDADNHRPSQDALEEQPMEEISKAADSENDTEAGNPSDITPTPTTSPSPTVEPSHTGPIILGFAGDVNLDESYYPAAKYDAEGQDISRCFTDGLLDEMRNADLMMINNEFSYSNRGTKEADKAFTFRAKPERVRILEDMGVDIVSLANNHALDYGEEALLDTFDTLEQAGIDYVGAGTDMDRAKAPVYKTVGDKTIAFVAASHVIFAMDWYAADDRPGMVGTYDPSIILESIREAKENSDFVVIFVHWGVERNTRPEKYQRNLAKMYIEAGADAVIGCHPHVMQGFEFYQGKPIAYSLGNYWFNASERESGMLKLYVNPDNTLKVQLLPVMNKDTVTYLESDEKKVKDYYEYIGKLSYDVVIDPEGFLTESN